MEAVDAAVVLGVAEQWLDRLLALAVEPPAVLGGQHRPHPRVAAAGPASPRGAAAALVGRDQHRNVLVGYHLVHVLLVPVAGIGCDRLGQMIDARPLQLAERRAHHRVELLVISAVSTTCCSLTAACAL